ncbi:hypothetical protein AJ78_02129 [Emergomyces pasteurianus Ep9510]|uniref:Uncharacterized protein n=1 Tax=Emergomyces pasteurianus Ep9510 TaxID=1447872 RepID=A0A1J9PMV9_9EURO|nr:hypothetical protein AJ78_02129 [Emergomyces pasteurianus Ep9510]
MEQFPPVEEASPSSSSPQVPTTSPPTNTDTLTPTRSNRTSKPSNASSTASRRLRSASLKFLESNPPSGMWMATGDIASRAPTINEIRSGCFSEYGWTEEGQMERRGSTAHDIQRRKLSRANTFASRAAAVQLNALREQEQRAQLLRTSTLPVCCNHTDTTEETKQTQRDDDASAPSTGHPPHISEKSILRALNTESVQAAETSAAPVPDETGTYPNGYRFPPKHTWNQATIIGLKAFGRFIITPFGLLVTIYGLNIVAWGAMIFFLLLNVAPAMCNPSCTARDSPRQIWIEIDSQVLNALFCVTGFGLIPWRFRDFYYLLQWRVMNSHDALRKLAGIHRSWFRLAGSDKLPSDIGPPPVMPSPSSNKRNNSNNNNNSSTSTSSWRSRNNTAYIYTETELNQLLQNPSLPLPPSSIPPAPLTGARAPPTKPFLLDLLVWMYVINTALQAGLAGIMWGLNRFTRPSWAVGFLIAAGCVTGMVAGGVTFWEGRRVKLVEGVPVEEEEEEKEEKEGDDGRRGVGAMEDGLGLGLERKKTTATWRKAKWYRRL